MPLFLFLVHVQPGKEILAPKILPRSRVSLQKIFGPEEALLEPLRNQPAEATAPALASVVSTGLTFGFPIGENVDTGVQVRFGPANRRQINILVATHPRRILPPQTH